MLLERKPALMGVLNVTPDSFSDGGRYLAPADALRHAHDLAKEGADFIDVGGESTRPGAVPVPVEEELRRTLPIVQALASSGLRVSIDTMKPEVAWEAGRAGARIINDVSGFRNPKMREVAAELGCTICIMHMLGEPRTMQASPQYTDVVTEVAAYLAEQAESCIAAGVARENIWIDPGIGFGKTVEHNLALLRATGTFVSLGFPVLIGVSRKSFIGKILGTSEEPLPVEERLEGSLVAQLYAAERGADILRCHEIGPMAKALKMANALR